MWGLYITDNKYGSLCRICAPEMAAFCFLGYFVWVFSFSQNSWVQMAGWEKWQLSCLPIFLSTTDHGGRKGGKKRERNMPDVFLACWCEGNGNKRWHFGIENIALTGV